MKNEYDITTNNRLYNILHKQKHARCCHCTWHTRWYGYQNENDAWDFYRIDSDRSKTKYPNWKLVSKQTKQWQPKNLLLIDKDPTFSYITWKEIRW